MTINEIAALSGVSRATVSRYLNNGYVSTEKREKIKKVIEETGYQPNLQAQMLRSKKTGLIDVVLPHLHSEAYSQMLEGISKVLKVRGYQMLLSLTEGDSKEELRLLKQLKENHVDGIIYVGITFSKGHLKAMKEITTPLVVLSHCVKDYTCVYQDDYGAAKELTQKALQSGNPIAFIGAIAEEEIVGHERFYGFLDAHFERNLEILEEYSVSCEDTFEAGYESAKNLLALHHDIHGFICASDVLALGALAYVKDIGLQIPLNIQIVGFDDSLGGKVSEPKLTTVKYHYKESGEEAAKLLLERIENPDTVQKEMKMGYQIIERKTV